MHWTSSSQDLYATGLDAIPIATARVMFEIANHTMVWLIDSVFDLFKHGRVFQLDSTKNHYVLTLALVKVSTRRFAPAGDRWKE
jgi:hypothetical protein